MLLGAAPEAGAQRLYVLPVRDYYDQARWADAVRAAVAPHAGAGARIALVGHFKDASSSYLDWFPDWQLVSLPRQGGMDATRIRDAWLGALPPPAPGTTHPPAELDAALDAALAPLLPDLPPPTQARLRAAAHTPAYAELQREWQMLREYRSEWACAPYPPVFVTVDALLLCQGKVLLIRRAQAPGRGLLALPGGFIEPRETLWQSCLRELAEETHCTLPEATLRAALRDVAVFDHPERSQRGRVISHVHCFDLGDAALPEVRGGDDASAAQWVDVAALAALEDQFHDDHFHILDHFLGLNLGRASAQGIRQADVAPMVVP